MSQASIQPQSEPGGNPKDGHEVKVIMELVDLNNEFLSHPIHIERLLKEAGIPSYTDIRKIEMFRFKITENNNWVKE